MTWVAARLADQPGSGIHGVPIMATPSAIEWPQRTWNAIAGCTKLSPGCAHCYAERMACRQAAMARKHPEQPGRWTHCLEVINARSHWNNTIDPVPEALNAPLQWRRLRVILGNSMSDLFHENVSVDFTRQVFDVINRCSRHTFQVLTKRSERLCDLSDQLPWAPDIWMFCRGWSGGQPWPVP